MILQYNDISHTHTIPNCTVHIDTRPYEAIRFDPVCTTGIMEHLPKIREVPVANT